MPFKISEEINQAWIKFLKNKNNGSISPNFLSLNEQEFIHETLENSLTIPNNDNQKVF